MQPPYCMLAVARRKGNTSVAYVFWAVPVSLGGAKIENAPRGRLAQLVRASRLHREGRRFESFIAHHFLDTKTGPFGPVGHVRFSVCYPIATKNLARDPLSLPALSDPLMGQHSKHVYVFASTLPNAIGAKRSLVRKPCATCDRGRSRILRHNLQEHASGPKLEQPASHQHDGASCETSPSRTCSQPVTELRYIRARPSVDAAHPRQLARHGIDNREGDAGRIARNRERMPVPLKAFDDRDSICRRVWRRAVVTLDRRILRRFGDEARLGAGPRSEHDHIVGQRHREGSPPSSVMPTRPSHSKEMRRLDSNRRASVHGFAPRPLTSTKTMAAAERRHERQVTTPVGKSPIDKALRIIPPGFIDYAPRLGAPTIRGIRHAREHGVSPLILLPDCYPNFGQQWPRVARVGKMDGPFRI